MPHLTDKLLRALKPNESRTEIGDDEVPGFRARVGAKGVAFHLRYRTQAGEQRNPQIGRYPALSVVAARDVARKWYADVRAGGDPSRTRQDERGAPIFADAARRWLAEHAVPTCKPTTARRYLVEIMLMRGSIIAQVLLGLVVGIACSRDLLDKDVEGERICRDYCEHWSDCGRQEGSSPSCFDSCMDNNGRGWEGECRFKRKDYYECLHGLSCENLALDQDADVPEEQRLCDDRRFEYSLCSSEHDS